MIVYINIQKTAATTGPLSNRSGAEQKIGTEELSCEGAFTQREAFYDHIYRCITIMHII